MATIISTNSEIRVISPSVPLIPALWGNGDDYIAIDPNPLYGKNQFSGAVRIFLTGGSSRILACKPASGQGFEINLTGTNLIRFNFSGLGITFNFGPITLNQWYEIGFSCNLTTKVARLYANGLLRATGTNAVINWGISPLMIGYSIFDNIKYYGVLQDLILFDRELSGAEMTDIYNVASPLCSILGHGITADDWTPGLAYGSPERCFVLPNGGGVLKDGVLM